MKKVFLLFLSSILIFLGLLYGFLFTPTGNSIVASYIEDFANEDKIANFKVDKFELTQNRLDFSLIIDEVSKINVKGQLSIFTKTVDLKYDVKVDDLSKLQKFTKQKLNGEFATSGTIKGDDKNTIINGISDLANSDTKYKVTLKEFKPNNITFIITDAKIDKLLYMLNQPIYASGDIFVNGKIKNANIPTLDGVILTQIKDGKVANDVVNKAFNQKLKEMISFKGDILTKLVPNKAVSKIEFFTTLANLFIKEAVVDLKTSNITSDYLLKVADLSKLYDVTATKMRGSLALNGEVKKSLNTLKVTGLSNLLGGDLNFTLNNSDFNAKVNNIEVKELTHMLYYPEFFTSKANVDLDFDLKSQKGKVKGNLLNGQFLPNEYSKLINTFAKFDLTREVYESIDLNSNIDKKIINSTVNMKSKLTKIDVTRSVLDLNKSTIEALVKTELKGVKFDTKVKGDMKSPKVSVDTSKLLKMKLKEEAKKQSKKLEKKLKEKLGEKAGKETTDDIIRGFKEFFGN